MNTNLDSKLKQRREEHFGLSQRIFLSKTSNILPKGNETLKYFLHFSSEMFALILPKQVCTWVNHPEGQMTPHTARVYPVAHTIR